MKVIYKYAFFLYLVSILFACNTNQISLNKYINKRIYKHLTPSYREKLNNMGWANTYFRGSSQRNFIHSIYKKYGAKGFYIIDTIHIDDYAIIEYENRSFIGPKEKILKCIETIKRNTKNKAHIKSEMLFDKDIYICGNGLLTFGYNVLFVDKNGIYKRNDTDMYKGDYDPRETRISKNLKLWKFINKPDYYLVGLIEWGYYFNLEFGEYYWSYDFYKEQMPRLGGYCKVAFPMYDK